MLPFEESKKMLNKHGHNYTDEEVKIIREFIAILIDIDYKLFKRRQEEELSNKQEQNHYNSVTVNHTIIG